MSYDREDSKFAIVLVGTALILVALSLLAITGILYVGMEKRYKIINARIDTMQQGITTFHVWNFEKNKMDIYLAAGISNTSPLPDSPIMPVYVTQSFFEKGLNKIRQRSVELTESNRVVFNHAQTKDN
jgi:hypothetical protein